MTVFELMATLGLDTNSFEEGLDAAKTGSTQATADIEKTFDSLDDTTTTFDTQLKDIRTRSDETSAIMEGVSPIHWRYSGRCHRRNHRIWQAIHRSRRKHRERAGGRVQ